MQIVPNLKQGTPEWHAHRLSHQNASDAPAMMGESKYKTRSQLLKECATGMAEEVDAGTQKLFDDGHRFEALCRPLAEKIVGDDLYPVIAVKGKRSASFDGVTLMNDTVWEHKSLNAELRAVLPAEGVGDESVGERLPLMNRIQIEQQAEISFCERVLFTASKWQGETLVEARHCWYRPDPALRAQIISGWAQFEADVAAYVPAQTVEVMEVVGHQPDQLPALRSAVRGELVLESNIKEWEDAALAYIKGVREHELKTDEDFANAAAASDWCEASKTTLLGVRASLMGATGDVNTAVATLDRIASELDKTRIAFDKAIKARKDARKEELVMAAQVKMREHMAALTARVGMPFVVAADFPGATKNLKSFASMEAKLDAELARAKIEASRLADLVQANRDAMTKAEAGHLFPDFTQVCMKAAEDFANLIVSRQAAARQREALAALALQNAAPAPAPVTPAPAPAPAPAARTFIGRSAAAPAANETPSLTLGEINARIAPLSIASAGLEQLGFPATKVKAACMYRHSQWPQIHAALMKKLAQAEAALEAA